MTAGKLVKMATDTILQGVFAINKPYGMSSAQVIRDCKTYFNPSTTFKPMMEREIAARVQVESYSQNKKRRHNKRPIEVKLGHGGTLDPMATGVLILGIGKGTKALHDFLGCTKTYETVVVFGASTDTYDRCGHVLSRRPYDHLTRDKVEKALAGFRGTYQQMPPLFSALKMEGKPLYEYAREGKPIPREIQTREVTVTELEMLDWYEPGSHSHHWPTDEATSAEKVYAAQLWRVEKQQVSGKKLTPEEVAEDDKALADHESLKRKFEEKQDELVFDKHPRKKQKNFNNNDNSNHNNNKGVQGKQQGSPVMMSGALGDLPPKGKGSDLVAPIDPGTPPPWEGKGPAAARFRMTVTSGFYVRSFAHDLGVKLESAGIMAELIRTRQGGFVLGGPNCLEYTDLIKGEAVWGPKIESILTRWNSPQGIFENGKAEEEEAKKDAAEEAKKDGADEVERGKAEEDQAVSDKAVPVRPKDTEAAIQEPKTSADEPKPVVNGVVEDAAEAA